MTDARGQTGEEVRGRTRKKTIPSVDQTNICHHRRQRSRLGRQVPSLYGRCYRSPLARHTSGINQLSPFSKQRIDIYRGDTSLYREIDHDLTLIALHRSQKRFQFVCALQCLIARVSTFWFATAPLLLLQSAWLEMWPNIATNHPKYLSARS